MDYHNKLNHKKLSYNKTFCKTVKPSFTDKELNQDSIFLIEENETVSDNDVWKTKQFICGYSETFEHSKVRGSLIQHLFNIDDQSKEPKKNLKTIRVFS